MGVDEWLHYRRDLPTWERIGHPLDTLTVLFGLLFINYFPYSEEHRMTYIGLCVFSCLFITKDEWVHQKVCIGFEHWLHALLFIVHPLVFLSMGMLWANDPEDPILNTAPIIVTGFMLYQILRWSIPWRIVK